MTKGAEVHGFRATAGSMSEVDHLRQDLADLALAAKSLVLLHNRTNSDNVCTILARKHIINVVLAKMRS